MEGRHGKDEPTTAAAGERHHALDLIRGLAALAVTQYHFMTWNEVASIESMGTFAVYLFFVLSGLTMMMVYHARFSSGLDRTTVRRFFRARVARLLPLLAVVALLAAAEQAIVDTADLPAAILTGTGLMALHMPGFLSNSVGAWSLGIELAFYAVFPVVAILVTSWREAVAISAVLLAAQHLLLWKIADSASFWDYYVSNLIFAPFFALGIWISFDRGRRRAAYLLLACAGLLGILGFSAAFSVDLMRSQTSYFGLSMLCVVVIWAAWRSRLPKFLVPVATFLGDVSYSLYLTHWIPNDLLRPLDLPLAPRWALFTSIALVGSFLSFRLFENPLRRRLTATPHPTTAAAETQQLP